MSLISKGFAPDNIFDRDRQSLNKECGWKGGDRSGLARWEQFGKRRNKEEEEK
jgi:hypothetical protein